MNTVLPASTALLEESFRHKMPRLCAGSTLVFLPFAQSRGEILIFIFLPSLPAIDRHAPTQRVSQRFRWVLADQGHKLWLSSPIGIRLDARPGEQKQTYGKAATQHTVLDSRFDESAIT